MIARSPVALGSISRAESLLRDLEQHGALRRELERDGQVFFVHNRVQTIGAMQSHLLKLIPEARITIAHGQMAAGELDDRMNAFYDGKFDVLVATTIVESGLDIPTANTMVIHRADMFGLAQLYQLRGRVGRSSRRAYAYLLYRRKAALSDIARKRLAAIFNASELGAGFQIALSDLEIRGAGNILGAEQHGHMAAVGFDLYTRMLAEAVEERLEALQSWRKIYWDEFIPLAHGVRQLATYYNDAVRPADRRQLARSPMKPDRWGPTE